MTAHLTRLAAALAGAAAGAQLAPAIVGCPGITGTVMRIVRPLPAGAVLLTFDDGPHPAGTPAVLDKLAAAGVLALFFVVGEQLVAHPELGRRIVAAGHEVAVHGWDHRREPSLSPRASIRGIQRTAAAVTDICGRAPQWYRPPYGVATGTTLLAAHRAGLTPLWWTRWGRDWSPRATPKTIAARLLGQHRPLGTGTGDILLLHDSDVYGTPGSWRRTADAVDRTIALARARGGEFVTAAALRPPAPEGP